MTAEAAATAATSRALATKYGFTLSNTGAGAATYAVPAADGAAFGLSTSTTSTVSVLNLLLLRPYWYPARHRHLR